MPSTDFDSLNISPSLLDLDTAVSISALSETQTARVANASILVVPTHYGYDNVEYAFPERTREVLQFIEAHLEPPVTIEPLTTDQDYIEVSLNSETLIIPELVTFGISIAEIVIPIVSSFIKRRLVKRHGTQEGSTVQSRLHVKRHNGDDILYEYNGPAATYERTHLAALDALGINESGDDHDDRG